MKKILFSIKCWFWVISCELRLRFNKKIRVEADEMFEDAFFEGFIKIKRLRKNGQGY